MPENCGDNRVKRRKVAEEFEFENQRNDEKVILSKIKNKEAILDSIKDFLGKGK